MTDKQEMIDIIETVYRGASKGRGLVVAPKGKGHDLTFRSLLFFPFSCLFFVVPPASFFFLPDSLETVLLFDPNEGIRLSFFF